jgi:hypothetical protein
MLRNVFNRFFGGGYAEPESDSDEDAEENES